MVFYNSVLPATSVIYRLLSHLTITSVPHLLSLTLKDIFPTYISNIVVNQFIINIKT